MSNDISNDHLPEDQLRRNVPWGPWRAAFGTVLSFLGAQVAIQVTIIVYIFAWHLSKSQVKALGDSIPAQFWVTLLAEAITLAIVWLFVRKWSWRKVLRGIGLRWPHWHDGAHALFGVILYLSAYTITLNLANAFFHINVQQEQAVGFQDATGFLPLAMAAISLVILPPLVEEIVFRGFLYGGLRKRLSPVVAALITSVVFAFPHLLEGSDGKLLWVAAIDTFTLSLVLCYLRERTGVIYAGMGVHAIKNSLAFVTIFILHLR